MAMEGHPAQIDNAALAIALPLAWPAALGGAVKTSHTTPYALLAYLDHPRGLERPLLLLSLLGLVVVRMTGVLLLLRVVVLLAVLDDGRVRHAVVHADLVGAHLVGLLRVTRVACKQETRNQNKLFNGRRVYLDDVHQTSPAGRNPD